MRLLINNRINRVIGFNCLFLSGGAAYIYALVGLTVGIICALALLFASSTVFLAALSRDNVLAARYAAESGIERMFFLYTTKSVTQVPYTQTWNFSNSSCTVSVQNDSARDPGTILIASIGTANGHTYTCKRIMKIAREPFEYALYTGKGQSEVKLSKGIISTVKSPGVYIYASKAGFDNSSTNITTGAYTNGATIVVKSGATVTPQETNQPVVSMDTINLASYATFANYVYYTGQTFTSLNFTSPTVIVVYGTVTIKPCVYSGKITIVSNNDINVDGNVTAARESDFLALVSSKKVVIKNAVTETNLIIYTHNTGFSGTCDIGDKLANQVGSIACNVLTLGSSTTYRFEGNPNWNYSVAAEMKMPGTF